MSTAVVPKRNRRRKRKPKLCENNGSTSPGSSDLPTSIEVVFPVFPEIPDFFTMHQKVHQEKRQSSVSGCDSKQVVAFQQRSKADCFQGSQPARNENWKTALTSHSIQHSSRKNQKVSSWKPAEREASGVADDVIAREKFRPTSLTESEAMDIVRRLRHVLKKNGPSKEDDLLDTLSTSQAKIIINAYGTISAFLDWRPGFEVIRGNWHTFIYYKCTDDEDDILDGGIAMPFTRRCNGSGLLHSVAGGGGPRRKGVISSDSPSHPTSAEGRGEKQKCRIKDWRTQVPWIPRHQSRGLQAVQERCDAESRTGRCYKDHFPEVKSTLQKHDRDLKITELKGSRSIMRDGRGREAQQLLQNVERIKTSPPQVTPQATPQARKARMQAPPQNVVEVKKNGSSRNAQERTQTSVAKANSSLQPPWPRQSQRLQSPLRGPKANEKPRGSKPWHVSRQRGKPPSSHLKDRPKPSGLPLKSISPSSQLKEEPKTCALPLKSMPPSPRGKENLMPRVLPRKSMPRPRPLPRQRSPSPRPKRGGKPRAHAAGMVLPALPQRRSVSPPVRKAEGNTRTPPVGPVYKSQSTKRPGAPPNPRPTSEESPHALTKVPTSRPTPLVDGKIVSAKQSPVPVCHQVPGHKKQVAAARLDAESTPSSKVEPPAKSRAEQYMSRLVQMVKSNKPGYTEQEIRWRLDNLRRAQGGFSHKTLNEILALMLGHLEAEEEHQKYVGEA
ncbi:hypothetical protein HPB50_023328 [Hyalomma asiaticum]|uniref:Uncharacterized protein n=1 Tax=Hyalomma asiaticum TaxID=266040 RepID=A0ACB7TQF7_HYAAI|nr:hypothetical protein HPB50_023328 [Hyalomma asiaticum]